MLVVGRPELQPELEPEFDALGIEHQWEQTGTAAARACAERRFEVALVDVGIRNPQAVLQALDLRGRRLRRAVILFSDGATPTPAGHQPARDGGRAGRRGGRGGADAALGGGAGRLTVRCRSAARPS